MLSGETSVGKYPVQVIQQMTRIIKSVEDSNLIQVPLVTPFIRSLRYVTNTICFHAAKMANDTNAKVITSLTNSGYALSAFRRTDLIRTFSSYFQQAYSHPVEPLVGGNDFLLRPLCFY